MLVCYTAVFSVVTQRSSSPPGEERCVTTLKRLCSRLSKCIKEIIQIELNWVKNPNWPSEANKMAIYREQIQLAVRAGLDLGAFE